MLQIELGDRVTDYITGFSGIVTARSVFLNGCVRLGVQPIEMKDGRPQELVWEDEQRFTEQSSATAGGPRQDAQRAPNPR